MKMQFQKGFNAGFIIIWLLGVAVALEVTIHEDWEEGKGWTVTCEWRFPKKDRLQSVRLHLNDSQFFLYRPEIHGESITYNAMVMSEYALEATCLQPGFGQSAELPGKCAVELRPLGPPSAAAKLQCEVSGERPTFYSAKKDHTVFPFVGPSKARLTVVRRESPRVTLNCSSSGLPAPELIWTVGNQQIQADHSDKAWNASSKQFDSWSLLSPLLGGRVECSPQGRYRGRLSYAPSAHYNSAMSLGGDVICLLTLAALAATLLR